MAIIWVEKVIKLKITAAASGVRIHSRLDAIQDPETNDRKTVEREAFSFVKRCSTRLFLQAARRALRRLRRWHGLLAQLDRGCSAPIIRLPTLLKSSRISEVAYADAIFIVRIVCPKFRFLEV